MKEVEQLRKLSRLDLAATLANMVRQVLLPESGWTIGAGRDCVDVLLMAASLAYPTSADIDECASRATQPTPPDAVSVGGQLAEELENEIQNI